MQKIEVIVETNDGTSDTYVVPPSVQIAAERHFKISLPGIGKDISLEIVYWLAFETLRKRSVISTSDFDVWLETVAGVETVGEPEEADPTNPTPSAT